MVDHERALKITKCNEYDRDWSSLPADILSDISSRLFFADYYSFADVCTSWRSAQLPLSCQMPFLFLRRLYYRPKPFCKLLNITNSICNEVHMPILAGKVFIGAQNGWLILVDNTICVISLYNPFSQKEIKLPTHLPIVIRLFSTDAAPRSETDFISKYFNFTKVVLSCAPISSDEHSVSAAALFNDGSFMYKRGGDMSWIHLFSPHFQDITTWRGMFVGVTRRGEAYLLNLDVPDRKFQYIGEGSPDHDTATTYYKRLVTLNNNLLQVWWLNDSQTRRTVKVKIMQLDRQQPTWFPVDNLCGHSLFLGKSPSFSLSSEHIPGLKDNLIYFIQDLEDNYEKRVIGVFNVISGTFEICAFPGTPISFGYFACWYAPPRSTLRNESF